MVFAFLLSILLCEFLRSSIAFELNHPKLPDKVDPPEYLTGRWLQNQGHVFEFANLWPVALVGGH